MELGNECKINSIETAMSKDMIWMVKAVLGLENGSAG